MTLILCILAVVFAKAVPLMFLFGVVHAHVATGVPAVGYFHCFLIVALIELITLQPDDLDL